MTEEAVIITFKYGRDSLDPLLELGDKLERAIEAAGAGEFDGDEVAADLSDARLYMYGPDADRLCEVVRPVLEAELDQEVTVLLQYGPPGANTPTRTVILNP